MQNSLTLSNGKVMPMLGFGTWRIAPEEAGAAVTAALETGYRHVDCAKVYKNEAAVGEAFHQAFTRQLKREEVFITGKLWNTDHHPDEVEAACRQTLADLQLEYLDLYLMHWGIAFEHGSDLEPMGPNGLAKTIPVSIQQTWQAMEQLVEKGLVKSIGVANFTPPMLVDLLTYAKIKPVVNQVEINAYNTQEALVTFCQKLGIAVTAYSPLGSSKTEFTDKPVGNPTVVALAQKIGKTPAQVLLRWVIQRGIIVLTKSTHPERILENTRVWDFELSEAEMNEISSLNRNARFVDPAEWWGVPYFK